MSQLRKTIEAIVRNPMFQAVLVELFRQWARKLGPRSAAVGTSLLGLLAGLEACAYAFDLPWWVHVFSGVLGGATTMAFGVTLAVKVGADDPTNEAIRSPAEIAKAKENALDAARYDFNHKLNL